MLTKLLLHGVHPASVFVLHGVGSFFLRRRFLVFTYPHEQPCSELHRENRVFYFLGGVDAPFLARVRVRERTTRPDEPGDMPER